MSETSDQLAEALEARVERRNERREFFRTAIGAAAVATAGAGMVGWSQHAKAATITDADIFNFALNLEYLEAQFYSYAAYGRGLDQTMLGGTGNQGAVLGGRQVNFTDPVVGRYAREIAQDEMQHVQFLRKTLGSAAIAQPQIDISTSSNSAFSNAARAAGLIGQGERFDVYASDENFLLGAYIFEDVGVTAYKGASPLVSNKAYLEAAAGILAVEAYHAAIVRTTLYAKGMDAQQLWTATDRISDARDSLDGKPQDNAAIGVAADDDQGISPTGSGASRQSNIVPLNANGIAYSRTPYQVHNIVYLTPREASMGGFFPQGTNGTLTTSANNA